MDVPVRARDRALGPPRRWPSAYPIRVADIRAAPGPARGDHRELLRLGRRSTRVIGPGTPVALDHGGRFSLDMAVDGLLASEGLLDAGARDRDSVRGRYSIDEQALTTSAAYGRLAVVDGQLVWD